MRDLINYHLAIEYQSAPKMESLKNAFALTEVGKQGIIDGGGKPHGFEQQHFAVPDL